MHRVNELVLRHYCREAPPVWVSPEDHTSPYWGARAHPEIVERVWDQLGAMLGREGRKLLCGTPVLLDPISGVIVATAMGTQYCLRLPAGALSEAVSLGYSSRTRWTDGTETDLRDELGEQWVFGSFRECEVRWLRGSIEEARVP